jgi:hypothetical protein
LELQQLYHTIWGQLRIANSVEMEKIELDQPPVMLLLKKQPAVKIRLEQMVLNVGVRELFVFFWT